MYSSVCVCVRRTAAEGGSVGDITCQVELCIWYLSLIAFIWLLIPRLWVHTRVPFSRPCKLDNTPHSPCSLKHIPPSPLEQGFYFVIELILGGVKDSCRRLGRSVVSRVRSLSSFPRNHTNQHCSSPTKEPGKELQTNTNITILTLMLYKQLNIPGVFRSTFSPHSIQLNKQSRFSEQCRTERCSSK